MAAFNAAYSVFKAKIGLVQDQALAAAKVQWAIHDRAKFKELIEDLKGFIDALKDITDTPESSKRQVQMEQEDVQSIRGDDASLRLLVEACADDHHEISEAASLCLELPYKGSEERMNIHSWLEDTKTPAFLLKHPDSFQSHHDIRTKEPVTAGTTFIVCKDRNFGDEAGCLRGHDIEAIARGGYGSLFGSRSLGTNVADAIDDKSSETSSPRLLGRQAKVYVYCSPSRPLLELALSMCGNVGPFRVIIRVDDRLCIEPHSHHTALRSVLSLDDMPDEAMNGFHTIRAFERSWITTHFDIPWARGRSETLETEPRVLQDEDEENSESSHLVEGSEVSVATLSFTDSGISMSQQLGNEDQSRLSKSLKRLAESEYHPKGLSFGMNWRDSWPGIIREIGQTASHFVKEDKFEGKVQHFLQCQTIPTWLESFPPVESDAAIATTAYCYILKNLQTAHGVRETLEALIDTSDALERCTALFKNFNAELSHESTEIYISVLEVLQAILHGCVYGKLESTSVSTDYSRQLRSAVSMVSRAVSRLQRRAANSIQADPNTDHEHEEIIPPIEDEPNFGVHTYLKLHKSDPTCAAIVVLASPSRCAQLMGQRPLMAPSTNPRDRHIFRLARDVRADDHEGALRPALYGKLKLNAAKPDISPVG
jgi:hypothetical protein